MVLAVPASGGLSHLPSLANLYAGNNGGVGNAGEGVVGAPLLPPLQDGNDPGADEETALPFRLRRWGIAGAELLLPGRALSRLPRGVGILPPTLGFTNSLLLPGQVNGVS